jgi:hypothetical protein
MAGSFAEQNKAPPAGLRPRPVLMATLIRSVIDDLPAL